MSKAEASTEVNSPEFWEYYMANRWDANEGRRQTRLFAKYFLDTVKLPAEARTLLDVSCAKGDALPEIHARHPSLKLYGADISEVAIGEARKAFGSIAEFQVAGFENLSRTYDVILCSNTLEHFENYLDIATSLLRHCRWLYVMVPYLELRHGKPLTPAPGEQHVVTFDEHSFEPLEDRGTARHIESWTLFTPIAWGIGPVPWWRKARAFIRGRPVPVDLRQIIFQIESAASPENCE